MLKRFLKTVINRIKLKVHSWTPNHLLRDVNCDANSRRCLENYWSKGYYHHLKGNNSPECCINNLYKILSATSEILNKNHIEYFLTYGSYLGARRNNGIIPWDTDIDIATTNNVDKVFSFLKNGLKNYSVKKENDHLIRIFLSDLNTLHVDIEIWEKSPNYMSFDDDIYVGRREINLDFVYPLRSLKFGEKEYPCPNSDNWLFQVYGKECLTSTRKKYEID